MQTTSWSKKYNGRSTKESLLKKKFLFILALKYTLTQYKAQHVSVSQDIG